MYENETYDENYNGIYQTSASAPEMRQSTQPVPEKPAGRGAGNYFRKLLAAISFGLCFGLFAGLGIFAVNRSIGESDPNGAMSEQQIREMIQETIRESATENTAGDSVQASSPSGIPVTQSVTAVTTDASEVVEEVMPAMVSIINDYVEQHTYLGGQKVEREYTASGSGIIVGENDTELLIATNYHVIADARRLTVHFIDGSDADAIVKGTDEDMDLAVIAIPLDNLQEGTKDAISIARLGDSNGLKLGEPVIAIGNALGYGQSVSGGYVSALDREIEMEDGSVGTFIQTDAAINPGNSGGALLNINGEVIGINTSKIGDYRVEGMGFAIPISAAQPILENLMNREDRSEIPSAMRGYIGIRLQTVTAEDAARYGMPTGIFIYEVFEDSAASRAGLLHGDIITKFDGRKVTSNEDLQDLLKYYRAGETVEVTVMRSQSGEYEEMIFQLTLGERTS
ncbi:MAG: PDZ domain-containing protein [Lachnospiraceae bacterium]|nr:PDZ domain-containing protein [Lachnospiraceae bacterium]